jgi:hypothetical protein
MIFTIIASFEGCCYAIHIEEQEIVHHDQRSCC